MDTKAYEQRIYTILIISSIVMMIYSNISRPWLILVALSLFVAFSVLNNCILENKQRKKHIISSINYLLTIVLIILDNGFGHIMLIVVMQILLSKSYSEKIWVSGSSFLYIISLVSIYLLPNKVDSSVYPALFISVLYLISIPIINIKNFYKLNEYKNKQRISELQLTKKKLNDLNNQIKEYNKELKKITVLRERNRVAKHIHDSLGHTLTTVMVQLNAALLVLDTDSSKAKGKIENAKMQTQEGFQSIKETLVRIREDETFREKIDNIIQQAKTNMGISFVQDVYIDDDIPITIQECIAAALKEGITNGIRHGKATAFVFRLKQNDDAYHFYLQDNGIGDSENIKGYGLTAMEQEVNRLNGSMEIHSQEGFVLEINIPHNGKEK